MIHKISPNAALSPLPAVNDGMCVSQENGIPRNGFCYPL